MCLAQEHNAVMPVRLEPTALLFWVKRSTTEPLRTLVSILFVNVKMPTNFLTFISRINFVPRWAWKNLYSNAWVKVQNFQNPELSTFKTFYGKSASKSWIQDKFWKLSPMVTVSLLNLYSPHLPFLAGLCWHFPISLSMRLHPFLTSLYALSSGIHHIILTLNDNR